VVVRLKTTVMANAPVETNRAYATTRSTKLKIKCRVPQASDVACTSVRTVTRAGVSIGWVGPRPTVQNRDMTSRSRIAAVLVAAMATLALGGCGGDKATLATFAGVWQAHARTLKITSTGNADEWISLGLGHFVIALRFHLSRPRGTPHDATATATVTAIRIGERSAFTAAHPPPSVGESRRIRLRDGVITETLTGAKYCSPSVDWLDAGCGA